MGEGQRSPQGAVVGDTVAILSDTWALFEHSDQTDEYRGLGVCTSFSVGSLFEL